MAKKLWEKNIDVNPEIERFTVGRDRELDLMLARYDVLGSLAHSAMLQSIGMLTLEEMQSLHGELRNIYGTIEDGGFSIEEGVEDVHSQVELMLTRKLGDIVKKIHSGRSRNDQILVDIKLFLRHEIAAIAADVQRLCASLLEMSDRNAKVLMPGYTHLQVAMPSSFGLWFGAYAESLADDLRVLRAAYDIANQNPLGSAAGYGSSFPLNRTMTTELLNFETMHYNVVAAQMSRGKTERATAYAIGAVASTLGRFAMDVCLFINQNFGFISFPDEYTTGSSIMPHKKNPDVFEIMRAKCNRLQSVAGEVALMTTNLPVGYQRDFQLLKDVMFPAIEEIKSCLTMCDMMLQHIRINRDILNDPKYDYLFTVEDVNRLALSGVPFREAYRQVGMLVQNHTYAPTREVQHTHEGSIGNLCNDRIREKLQQVISEFE